MAAILVVNFGLSPRDAWDCTVVEYWEYQRVWLISHGHDPDEIMRGPRFRSADDVRDFETYLIEQGYI